MPDIINAHKIPHFVIKSNSFLRIAPGFELRVFGLTMMAWSPLLFSNEILSPDATSDANIIIFPLALGVALFVSGFIVKFKVEMKRNIVIEELSNPAFILLAITFAIILLASFYVFFV